MKDFQRQEILWELQDGENIGTLDLTVDFDLDKIEGTLKLKVENGSEQTILVEKGRFSEKELDYPVAEAELCGLTKILGQMQHVLEKQNFNLVVFSEKLVDILNEPDLKNSRVKRWINYLLKFSPNIIHRSRYKSRFQNAR